MRFFFFSEERAMLQAAGREGEQAGESCSWAQIQSTGLGPAGVRSLKHGAHAQQSSRSTESRSGLQWKWQGARVIEPGQLGPTPCFPVGSQQLHMVAGNGARPLTPLHGASPPSSV